MNNVSKSPSMSQRSRIARQAIFACLLFALSVAVIGFAYFPIQSLLWHLGHSDYLMLGRTKMKLPLLWWRKDDSINGSIAIRHAAFATSEANSIDVSPLSGNQAIETDKDALRWQAAFFTALHGASRRSVRTKTISAHGIQAYCVTDESLEASVYLACRAPRLEWGILFVGSSKEEIGAESIVASLQLSDQSAE